MEESDKFINSIAYTSPIVHASKLKIEYKSQINYSDDESIDLEEDSLDDDSTDGDGFDGGDSGGGGASEDF